MLSPIPIPRSRAYRAGWEAYAPGERLERAGLTRLLLECGIPALRGGAHLLAGGGVVLHAEGCVLARAELEVTPEEPLLLGCVVCASTSVADRLGGWVEDVLQVLHRFDEEEDPEAVGEDRAWALTSLASLRAECDPRWGGESAGGPGWNLAALSEEDEQYLAGLADSYLTAQLRVRGLGEVVRGEVALYTTTSVLAQCCPELVLGCVPLRVCEEGVLVACTEEEVRAVEARSSWLSRQVALRAGVHPAALGEDASERWGLALELLGHGELAADALERALVSAAEALGPVRSC